MEKVLEINVDLDEIYEVKGAAEHHEPGEHVVRAYRTGDLFSAEDVLGGILDGDVDVIQGVFI